MRFRKRFLFAQPSQLAFEILLGEHIRYNDSSKRDTRCNNTRYPHFHSSALFHILLFISFRRARTPRGIPILRIKRHYRKSSIDIMLSEQMRNEIEETSLWLIHRWQNATYQNFETIGYRSAVSLDLTLENEALLSYPSRNRPPWSTIQNDR